MKSSKTFFYVMIGHVLCLGLVLGARLYRDHDAHQAAKPVMRLKTVIQTLTDFRKSRKSFPSGFAETDLVSRMKFLAEADDRTVTRDASRSRLDEAGRRRAQSSQTGLEPSQQRGRPADAGRMNHV